MSDDKVYTREEIEGKLTSKEYKFCHEYIKDWNKAAASRRAGYSVNNCRQTGYELTTKPYIKQYIDFIKDDIAREAGISKLLLINRLKVFAFSSLPDIIEKYESGGIDALNEDEKSCITDYVKKERTVSNGENGESTVIDSETRFKIESSRGAIQDIMKAMGWNEPDESAVILNDYREIHTFVDGSIVRDGSDS